MVKEISVNDKLPNFSLEATIINTCKDADLLGQWAVLFIYPKDNSNRSQKCLTRILMNIRSISSLERRDNGRKYPF